MSETLKEIIKIIHFHNSACISYVNLFITAYPLTKLVQSEVSIYVLKYWRFVWSFFGYINIQCPQILEVYLQVFQLIC